MRLVNGRTSNEGRLEICFHNHWGTVCDDSFHIKEASIVCRALGFPSEGIHTHYPLSTMYISLLLDIGALSLHSAYFGRGVGLILLDEVECRGNETTLFDCSHSGIGINNCLHEEDISILCKSENGRRREMK